MELLREDLKKVQGVLKKENISLFLFYSAVGFITYSSFIISELANPDTIWNGIYYKYDWGWEASLGRYMIRIFQEIFGHVINTATFTILSIFTVAIIGILVKDILDLDLVSSVFAGIIIMLAPTISATLSYYYCSFYYILAYFFVVISAWIMCKWKHGIGIILGGGLLCVSIATYQAYVSVFLVLCLSFIIKEIAKEKDDIKTILSRIGYMGVTLILGIGSYLLSNKIILMLWGVKLEGGRGFSKMGKIPLGRFFELLKNCYIYTYEYYFSDEMINNPSLNLENVNKLFFVLSFFILLKLFWKMKKITFKILLVLGILIFPIMIMSITIAASDVSIYDTTGILMLPTTSYIYIFIYSLWDKKKVENISLLLKRCVVLLSVVFVFLLFSFNLSVQTYQKYRMNKMDYLAKNIVDTIEDKIDYSDNYKLCFIGEAEKGNYPELYPELLEKLHWTTASYGTVWSGYMGTHSTWIQYIQQYTGRIYEKCLEEDYNEIRESNFIKDMDNYPYDNSIKIWNEKIIVIKLSD